jgi:amino acid transporter
MPTEATAPLRGPVRVVVATTVFLSFISFWRAAAIVLADLGSSAFYAGGIAEQAVGKAAPWFILGVMLFSYAVCAIYIESSVMFVRGGVYRVVKEAMGGTMAKLSVSALLFDYVLTGPISAVSAGQYVAGLLGDLTSRSGVHLALPTDSIAAGLAALVVIYFWWRNTQGIRESSHDAMRIAQITAVMGVMLLAWAVITLLARGGHLPPAPTVQNLRFSSDALGWLKGTRWPTFTAIAVLVGLGHSFLAMSGYETLAQVYREIEHPKAKNLRRTGVVIFISSLVFTSSVSFLAVGLIPDDVRPRFYDNLISGLAMHLVGPLDLRLAFQAFVVLVGFLILAGAANTAIVGSNAVLNRVSEDGVLPEWFRRPHHRFGTSYRIINLIAGLQLLTILLSRGHVYLLGEAYAFGVVWSFTMKALAVLVLRFTEPGQREWRVPVNFRIGSVELPIGLAAITLGLLSVAVINLTTKQVATIAGLAFTLVLYVGLVLSERATARRKAAADAHAVDQFQLLTAPDVGLDEIAARAGGVLVPVRDYNTLAHLRWALNHTDTSKRDIVVMTVRLLQGPDTGFRDLRTDRLFTDYEQLLFTRVVAVAEREGRPVRLLVVPSSNVFHAIAQTAVNLESTEIILGDSAKFTAADQARLLGEAWERIKRSEELRTRLLAYKSSGEIETFPLGPHAPPLTLDDLDLIHRLWLKAVARIGLEVHHRDIVRAALEQFEAEMSDGGDGKALEAIQRQVKAGSTERPGRGGDRESRA